jgi:CDP-diacylglycerol--glycerol-3-phosphate 3-phosphatidyltransferase
VSGQPQTGPVVPRVRVTNLANVLTLLRLVLVPVFLLALFAGNGHETASRIVAFVVFAVAVITDRLDGALARNYGMVTEFGTMADPIADKTLIGAALIGLSMLGDLPWWVTVVSSRPVAAANSRPSSRPSRSDCSCCRCRGRGWWPRR